MRGTSLPDLTTYHAMLPKKEKPMAIQLKHRSTSSLFFKRGKNAFRPQCKPQTTSWAWHGDRTAGLKNRISLTVLDALSGCSSQVCWGPRIAHTQLLLVCLRCCGFIFNLLARKEAVRGVQPSTCTWLLQTTLELEKENRWTPLLHSRSPKERRGTRSWSEVREESVRICLSRIDFKKKKRKADKSSSNHQLQLVKHSSSCCVC